MNRLFVRIACLALIAIAFSAAAPLPDDVVPEHTPRFVLVSGRLVQEDRADTHPPTVKVKEPKEPKVDDKTHNEDWSMDEDMDSGETAAKVKKADKAGVSKTTNDEGATDAKDDNMKEAAEVKKMDKAAIEDDVKVKVAEKESGPLYDAESEVEAFGANAKDVNGKTYGQELAALKKKAAAKKAAEEKKEAALMKKRNAEIAAAEKKDDARLKKLFGPK
jgi:hypothetical protein